MSSGSASASRLGSRLVYVMLLGVVVYGVLIAVRGFDQIRRELATFAWWTFAAACGLSFVNYSLRFLKWEYYLAVLGLSRDPKTGARTIPRGESFLVFLSGFVLTVSPGKVGEVFKSLVLWETRGIEAERTAPIVVAERLTDLVGVIVLITIGGSTFPGGLVWAAAGAGVVLTLLVLVSSPRLASRCLAPLPRLPGFLGRFGARFAPRVERALVELRHLTSFKHLWVPSFLSIAGWALEGVGVRVILHGFSNHLDVLRATFFYATGTLAGALVPVPGGLGVTEKILEESMVKIGGVPGPTATATMLLARFATLWFAVLVGFGALALLRLRYPTLLARPEPETKSVQL
ncbi:MAG: lysylphosphatidylglycerol synthase transmembrane domain-containing protein [Polyangiaceae bacterium]